MSSKIFRRKYLYKTGALPIMRKVDGIVQLTFQIKKKHTIALEAIGVV